jgi:hypothetical protein
MANDTVTVSSTANETDNTDLLLQGLASTGTVGSILSTVLGLTGLLDDPKAELPEVDERIDPELIAAKEGFKRKAATARRGTLFSGLVEDVKREASTGARRISRSGRREGFEAEFRGIGRVSNKLLENISGKADLFDQRFLESLAAIEQRRKEIRDKQFGLGLTQFAQESARETQREQDAFANLTAGLSGLTASGTSLIAGSTGGTAKKETPVETDILGEFTTPAVPIEDVAGFE